eukprot:2557899-Amphidinium_carterae.1
MLHVHFVSTTDSVACTASRARPILPTGVCKSRSIGIKTAELPAGIHSSLQGLVCQAKHPQRFRLAPHYRHSRGTSSQWN